MYEKDYTVEEIYGLVANSCHIQVESAYNGKILCKAYNPKKHDEISARVVCSISPCFSLSKNKDFARAYLRVFVNGFIEWEQERIKKESETK